MQFISAGARGCRQKTFMQSGSCGKNFLWKVIYPTTNVIGLLQLFTALSVKKGEGSDSFSRTTSEDLFFFRTVGSM